MTDFSAINELIRRARLAESLKNIGGQGQVGELPPETPVQSPMSGQPIQQPVRPAQSEYQEALKQPAPSINDYHPSLKRRIFGSILGGFAGLHDPKTGYEVGRGITMGPFDAKMSDYQRRLAQKKEAFETEQAAGKESALEAELTERRGAEHARAGAEEARRKHTEYLDTPEGQQFQLELAGVRHPGAKSKRDIYKVTLNNDKEVLGYLNDDNQMVESETGVVLGPDSYKAKEVYKLGTEPKPTSEKDQNEFQTFKSAYLEKNPKASGLEISDAWEKQKAKYAKPEHTPQALMIDPEGLARLVRPGTKVPEGSETPAGKSSENVPTAATRQMAETAPKVIDLVDRSMQLINEQEKSLGPASSRWSEFMSGKVGAPNPEFTKLRTNVILLRSLLMRMHMGARGGVQMMNHFRELIDVSMQSPENMRAALDEIKAYANDVAKGGKKEVKGTETPDKKDPLNILK